MVIITMNNDSLFPLDEFAHDLGYRSRSTLYLHIRQGTLPPPLKLGKRSVFRRTEAASLKDAIVKGMSDDERRALVQDLVAARGGAAA